MITLTYNDGVETPTVYQVGADANAALAALLPTMMTSQPVVVDGQVTGYTNVQTYPTIQAFLLAVLAQYIFVPALTYAKSAGTAAAFAAVVTAQQAAQAALISDVAAAISVVEAS
jgi:hypothetical protein